MSQIDQASLVALGNFPALLEAAYAAVPNDQKHWRPSSWDGIPSERLTAIEQICHVHDIEVDGYHVRFRRTLTENQPVLPDLGGELLAQERNYSAANATDVLARFRAARAQTIRAVSAFTAYQLERVAIFENDVGADSSCCFEELGRTLIRTRRWNEPCLTRPFDSIVRQRRVIDIGGRADG